ncbi:SMP-30/gluconolactonase/LRE family protein [Flammeovirga sp. EKP202]|uniref:SMP-30/gluconolactonase/LRE family protein n=1 Tax=Flammeovirga sp. EKP202 TaxID=2770592 RepID=UPI00165F3FD8|nr:SMP-30/gluconolactonase/LRE family protein [Flammeovirga sp. EKP202]MBD0404066.1 SMP-30/gluconolactonase/LRE family protein [Flammeovirga sp. EKP202]
MMKKVMQLPLFLWFILVSTNLFLQSCALKPLAWTPPEKPELTSNTAENELLKSTEWIGLNNWYGPEDIAVDKEGNLYCGAHKTATDFSDGRVLKIDTTGQVSVFCNTQEWVAGLHFDSDQNLIACVPNKGLVSINPKGEMTILASEDQSGQKFLIPNDVDIATDGMIYFSNTSSKVPFSRLNARKIIFEVKPDGGLYRYNPNTKKVESLINGTYFGNGVAVSSNDEFVLMVELTKYRILRYWLKGDKKGKTDIFIDNLPGIPNGISRRANGSFWLGFSTKRNDLLDKIQPKTGMKKFIFGVPLWLQPKQEAFGMIMHLSAKGEILKTYYDTSGKVVSEASSIKEHNGFLYIGGDLTDHIGKYKLDNQLILEQ